jgi:hypothetical protein
LLEIHAPTQPENSVAPSVAGIPHFTSIAEIEAKDESFGDYPSRNSNNYAFDELVFIYRRYAQFKGWNTSECVVRDKVEGWVDSMIGPVGLAIDFYETGKDNAKHLGWDAEARASNVSNIHIQDIQHFFTKVVGVTYKNHDGTSRQSIISKCHKLETLDLKIEDDNPVDPNAIMVCKLSGEQIGHLNAKLAREVALNSRKGYQYSTHITAITGGDKDHPTQGCNLLITVAKPGVSDQQVIDYFNRIIANDKGLLQELGVDSLTAIPSKE